MKFSKSLLVLIPIISIIFSVNTHSQDQDIEEVIVYGKAIKESQQAAIEAKRSAPNLAEVISADAIGRFPDVNLSDSLGRLRVYQLKETKGKPDMLASEELQKDIQRRPLMALISLVLKMVVFPDLTLTLQ
jgi:hypothetical protein